MARLNDCNEWFEIWFSDKKAMISVMYANLAADLNAGYDPFGHSITYQKGMIASYENEFERTLDTFKTMTETEVNRWCFYDMKKRGVID